jgi:pathogenesis-related protein 1
MGSKSVEFFKYTSALRILAVAWLLTSCTADALDVSEQSQILQAHNHYRGQVGVASLIWSTSLANTAQAYADKLQAFEGCAPSHSKATGLGENIFWASALVYSNGRRELQDITQAQVAHAWGSEREHYSYGSNTCAKGEICGHYTQMVWQTTTALGCGHAVCADSSQLWVCHYFPQGNYVGERPY